MILPQNMMVESVPRTKETPSQPSLSTPPRLLMMAGWISATMLLSREKRKVEDIMLVTMRSHYIVCGQYVLSSLSLYS